MFARVLGVLVLATLVVYIAVQFMPTPVAPVKPLLVTTAYARVTLTCGCTLRIRNNTECCAKAYPDLGQALSDVKQWTLHYRDVNEPMDDNPKTLLGGDYKMVPLKCGCAISVYVPDTCPCFDREHYPELIAALDQVYGLVKRYSK